MTYQVIARKYRPMTFDDVVGQNHVTSTLRNAIATNRVAHAYLFSGTRGCGKTTTARILARALNCISPQNYNPDNTCQLCVEILEGRSLDVIEIDGASNRGVDEIRNLRDSVRYTPVHGKYKVYIIDEVHMLTKEAFNALLKTLEEPPPHVVFIFATTEVHKMPMTILSRCQRFDFRRIPVSDIVTNLKAIAEAETISVEPEALQIIAKRADGSLRDAQSIFEQVRSFCGATITAKELLDAFHVVDTDVYFQLTSVIRQHDATAAIELLNSIVQGGYDIREFVGGFVEHLRNLLIVKSTTSHQVLEISETYRQKYNTEAKDFDELDLLRYLRLATELEQTLRWASQPRYRLEASILQMVYMDKTIHIQQLLSLLEEVKKQFLHSSSGTLVSLEKKSLILTGSIKERSNIYKDDIKKKEPQQQLSSTVPLSNTNNIKEKAVLSSSPQIVQPVTMDEVLQHWQTFVEEVSQEKIALGISLKVAQPVDVNNGCLKIGCSDIYHYESLKRGKDFLTKIIQKVTSKKLVIDPILNNQVQPKQKNEASTTDLNSGHPIIDLLKSELGAERIE